MHFKGMKAMAMVLCAMMALTGCSSTKFAQDWNGVTSPDGTPTAHVSTSNMALHLLVGKQPLAGDASLAKTVDDFTAAAKSTGATKVRIVQSNCRAWWFLLFPFTLVITPVTSNVAGDAIK